MADNISGSAAWLGGVEIVNDQRTYAYLTQCEDFNFKISGNCSCSNIRELADCDAEDYVSPAVDEAPWYDPLIPESANFAGFLVSEFNGLGSTFTREIAETISDGGVLGRSRLASRTLTWRGFLFGSTCCAVAYGLRWLGKQFQGTKNCGNSCFGDDLEILMCCPTFDESQGLGSNLFSKVWEEGNVDTTISNVAQPSLGDSGSVRIVSDDVYAIVDSESIEVSPGIVYRISLPVYGSTSIQFEFSVDWYDALDVLISTSSSGPICSTSAGGWETCDYSATAPNNAATAIFHVTIGDGVTDLTGEEFFIDYDNVEIQGFENNPIDAFRTMKNVGLLEGPLIISQRKGGCGCGASCIVEIEFSLGSPQPYLYGTPIPVVNCVNAAENSIDIVSSETEDCPPIDCGLPVAEALADFFPDCDPGDLPPVPTYTNTCLSDDVTGYRAVYITAQRSLWDSLSDVVPVITIINNNSIPIYSMRLGFYTSANGNPCGDLINNPPLCDSICDTLGIVFIPGNSQFYIDGRTKKMSLVCGTNTVFPGEPYTSGPFSWPSFDCYGFCMEFAYAPMFLYEAPVEDVCVSLSLVPRTSL